MLRLLSVSVVALALSAAGCSTAQTPEAPDSAETNARVRTPDAGEPFRLALGESVEREGHEISFVEVVEDSRCPTGVQCAWAGTAKIRVSIDGNPFVLTLPHTGGRDGEAQMIEWGDVQVVFVGLEPYPGNSVAEGPAGALLITRPSTV